MTIKKKFPIAGGGDVLGPQPGASTDNAIVRWDGVTGRMIQDSGITVDDSNNMVIPGNLTVNGTTTTVNSATLDVTDANITVNNGGSDATAEGAGLTVERTGTDGSLIYQDALASKFAIGPAGAEVEVVGTTFGQTISNKTMDANSNTFTNFEHGSEVDNPTSGVHGVTGNVVGTTDAQTLTNKTMDANSNTFSNFEHGAEVDNPSSGVHGVTGSVVGTTDTQTLTNKTIDANSNTLSNLEHGAEVDNPTSGVHGVTGNVVGTTDSQVLSNKTIETNSEIADSSDNTKQLAVDLAGATTTTTTTFDLNQTADRTITFPDATDTVVLEAAAQTLTNKTIAAGSNTITGLTHGSEVDNPTSGVHGVTGNVVGTTDTQTLSNKTIIADNSQVVDSADNTKEVDFDVSGATTGTTTTLDFNQTANRTLVFPDITDTVVTTNAAQSLTNKGLSTTSTQFRDFSDASKQLDFDLAGATTATTTTIDANQTVDRTITLPDESGTVALNPTTTQGDLIARGASTLERLAVGTDGQVLTANSATSTGLEWSSSAGGGGLGINYIDNSGAEDLTTTGWVRYQDAAQTTPVDGTGGTPTLSFSAYTVQTLRDNANFLMTKVGDLQGQGVAYDFTIDDADLSKPLVISFDYTSDDPDFAYNGGVAGDESDLMIYVYDVTNATLIRPLISGLDGSGRFVSSFQADSTSTSYRLIFHVATNNAATWTFRLDNVQVGPSQTAVIPAVTTDWVDDPSPTINNLPTSTLTVKYRRVGDTMHVRFTAEASGAATGLISLDIPAGLSIDTAKLNQTVTNRGSLGTATLEDNGTNFRLAQVQYNNSTSVVFVYDSSTGGANVTTPFTWAANDEIHGTFTVPISGWSSGRESAVAVDSNRPVFAEYYADGSSANISIATATVEIMDLNVKVTDSHGAVTTGASWTFTCPVSGIYHVSAAYHPTAMTAIGTSRQVDLSVYVNGSYHRQLGNIRGYNTAGSAVYPVNGAIDVQLNAGDTLNVRGFQDINGVANNINTASQLNRFSIHKVDSGSPLAALTEKVVVHYQDTSNFSFNNANSYSIGFDTKVIDTHNSVTIGASSSGGVLWFMTAPKSGFYKIRYGITFESGIMTASVGHVNMFTYVDGSNSGTPQQAREIPQSDRGTYTHEAIHQLNAGQTLAGGINQTNGGGRAMSAAQVRNNIYIESL